MPVEYEPLSPRWREDPYPAYRRLRDEDPVHWAPESRMFCVSRFADVHAVLTDPERFSSSAMNTVLNDMGGMTPRLAFELLRFLWKTRANPIALQQRGSLISMDPPRHDALRAIVSRGFVPRRIAAWEARARSLVSESLRAWRPGVPFDLIEGLAVPLPVTIIAELLGVEPERRQDFKRWSDTIIQVTSGASRGNPAGSGLLGEFTDLFLYLQEKIAERRAEPKDDLLSLLVDASQEDSLDEIDTVQFVVLLLVAGNETTTNLIGNAVAALLENPEQLAHVAADPSLVPALVEEALRFDTPVQMVFRQATCDTEIDGRPVPKDAVMALLLGSANHDERVFDDAERFDVTRDARGHLGFGFGKHFCLGAALARLEARVALEELVPVLVDAKPVGAPSPLIDSFLVRGRARLELERGAA